MSITGQVLRLHEALYKRTDGRVGHRMIGVPTLLLRTTGRRSGATRTNGLVYARDGDDYLVVASNGGADRAPAWLHNLRSHPETEIQIAGERRKVRAREATAQERRRLWPKAAKYNPHWGRYRERTSREIPLVLLEPR